MYNLRTRFVAFTSIREYIEYKLIGKFGPSLHEEISINMRNHVIIDNLN